MSNSSEPHGLQNARLSCSSLSPGVCSNLCPLSLLFFLKDSNLFMGHFAQPARGIEASVLTLADPSVLTTAQSAYETTARTPGPPAHPGPMATPTGILLSHHLLPPIPFLRQFSLPHGRPCSLIGEQVEAALSLPDGKRHQPRPWLQPGWLPAYPGAQNHVLTFQRSITV